MLKCILACMIKNVDILILIIIKCSKRKILYECVFGDMVFQVLSSKLISFLLHNMLVMMSQ